MSQLITINLSKAPGASWGFRLQGGKDFAQPLCIQKVNVGSVAEAAGLAAGDAIVSIGSTDGLALRHKEAQDAIVRAGNSFQMVVQRGAMTWRPQVTALAQPKKTPEGPVATQTSLAAPGKQPTKDVDQQQRAPKGFNAVPAGFGEVNGQPVVNPQYNSPINLYNEDSIAEALSAQSEVLGKGCLGINFRKFDREVKLRTDSPTYQMIHGEDVAGGPKARKQLPAQEEGPQQPKPVFPAPQPGQQGYYNINDKMYCDVHAKQAAKHNPPGPNMVPVTVLPGTAPPAGAMPASAVKAPAPLAAAPPAFDETAALLSEAYQKLEQEELTQQGNKFDNKLELRCGKQAPHEKKSSDTNLQSNQNTQCLGSTVTDAQLLAMQDTTACDKRSTYNSTNDNYLDRQKTLNEAFNAPMTREHKLSANQPLVGGEQEPERQEMTLGQQSPQNKPEPAPAPPAAEEVPVELAPPEPQPEEAPTDAVAEEEPQEQPVVAQEDLEEPEEFFGPAEVNGPATDAQEPAGEPSAAAEEVTQTTESTEAVEPAQEVQEAPAVEAEPETQAQEPEAPVDQEPVEVQQEQPEAVEEAPVETESAPQAEAEPEPQPAPEPQQAEPEPELVPEPEPEILEAPAADEEQPVLVQEFVAPSRVVASEPAPSFAPAPAPLPSQPVAPGGSSANPAAFGGPSGGFDVRSHIPKKAARFVWPPRRAASEEGVTSHSPSWAPAGEVLKVPMPVHTGGPPPKIIPLLPTPPPPKDYESMVLASSSVNQMQQQQQVVEQSQTVQRSSSATSTQQKTVVQTTFETKSTSVSASSFNMSSSAVLTNSSSTGAVGNLMKGKISPPKSVPVTLPMPTVNFGSNPGLPSMAPSKPVVATVKPETTALVSGGLKRSATIPGVKSVKPPVLAPKKSDSFGFKPVKPKFGAQSKQGASEAPVPAPIRPAAPTPIDVSSLPFAIPPAPFSEPLSTVAPAPAAPKATPKATPKVTPKVTPKPATSQPPKPAGPVAPPVQAPAAPKPAPVAAPAPVFAPAPAPVLAPAPKPAPAPMFGGGGMPKPVPPPGMGGLAKPPGMGGPPTKGIPGERTAPKRGRGVMNPAHTSRIPICANCQRQIRGPFVTALGKNWCPDHFHCATESCRKPLIDVGFVEEQGSLYCEDCYEKYLAPTCGKCDKRIKGDCLNAVGKQFHPECFCCAYCGKVFGSGAFYLEDGLPYCETDWNDLFTTKCVGCGFPIEAGDRWVEALNNNYHSQCFKCSKCHKNLEGQSFFAKGGKPFCKSHAQRGF